MSRLARPAMLVMLLALAVGVSSPPAPASAAITDPSLSGYIIQGQTGSYKSVSGSWDVPYLTTSGDWGSTLATWVGIGPGTSTTDLLQTGVSQVVDKSGNAPAPTAWYELVIHGAGTCDASNNDCNPTSFSPNLVVRPGDRMTATITPNASHPPNNYQLTLTDDTTNQTGVGYEYYPGNNESAEWIAEAPTYASCGVPLQFPCCPNQPQPGHCPPANYGSVTFEGMTLNGQSPWASGLTNGNYVQMVQNNQIVSNPSQLNREADSFTLGYKANPAPAHPDSANRQRIAVGRDPNGVLQVFMVGEDDKLYTTTEAAANGAFTNGWHSLGGGWPNGEDVTVGTNSNGSRLELFMLNQQGQLMHDYEKASTCAYQWYDSRCWSGWSSISGSWRFPTDDAIGVGRDNSGNMMVFLIGLNEHLYSLIQQPGTATGWASSFSLVDGTKIWPNDDSIAVAPNQNGLLELFIGIPDQDVYGMFQYQNGTVRDWTAPVATGSQEYAPGAPIAIGRNSDGRLEIFMVSGDGYTYHDYQKAANDSAINSNDWSGWQRMGTYPFLSDPEETSLVVRPNQNGRLQLFMTNQNDTYLYSDYQLASGWSGWFQFAKGINQPPWDAIGVNSDLNGAINLFLVNQTNHQLYTDYQTTINGAWSGYQEMPFSNVFWVD